MQEAFVKLWENRQNFSSLLTIRSYLYTIVRNSGINYLRYVKMKAEKLEERGEETETSAVELIIRQEVERQLLEMIQELTPECRRVVNLLSEGKSYKEVGYISHDGELFVYDEVIATQRKEEERKRKAEKENSHGTQVDKLYQICTH